MAKTEEGEPDKPGLVLHVKLSEDKLEELTAEGVRTHILAGAIDHILTQLTPERLRLVADEWAKSILNDVSSWRLEQIARGQWEPMLTEAVQRPEFLALCRKAVEQGLELAMKEIPAKVKDSILQRVERAILRDDR